LNHPFHRPISSFGSRMPGKQTKNNKIKESSTHLPPPCPSLRPFSFRCALHFSVPLLYAQ
jgi:hypothetical protein